MGDARGGTKNETPKGTRTHQSISPSFKQSQSRVDLGKFLEVYQPDTEFLSIERPTPSMFSRFIEALFDEKGNASKIGGIESARIFEVNRIGGYRVRTVHTTAALRSAIKKAEEKYGIVRDLVESGLKLKEAGKIDKAERKLRENFFDLEDPAQTVDGNNSFSEYVPIMGGPFSKQLYLHDMLDGFAKAFEAFNHNPIAHQGVKIITHFVLGRGVSWKACHPECQKAFDAWADKMDLNSRLEFWCDTISRDGELMLRKGKTPGGSLAVRWVDPSTVWDIITDLEDMETGVGASSIGVYYYHQQFPTQYQLLYSGGPNQIFNPSRFESAKYIINQIPADEMLHYKINVGPNEKRGRSDLFPVLGWLKRYKDFWTAHVIRAIGQSTFIWKNKLKGSDTDVQAFLSQFGTQLPQFGSIWAENEASELLPMSMDIKGADASDEATGIINMIAVGLGIPKEYLGFAEQTNRASSVVASEPGTKKFQSRQNLFARVLRDISQAWGEMEMAAGRIPAQMLNEETGEVEDHKIKIDFQFPEIAIEDRSLKIKDIDFAVSGNYIPRSDGAGMIAKELGIENYDYAKVKEKIAQEEQEKAQSIYSQFGAPALPGTPPAAPGAEPEPEGKSTGSLGSSEKRAIKKAGRS